MLATTPSASSQLPAGTSSPFLRISGVRRRSGLLMASSSQRPRSQSQPSSTSSFGAAILAQHLVHAHVQPHVAADRAVAADARRAPQLPGTRHEAIVLGGQRADRAHLDDVAGEDRVERRIGLDADLGLEAALLHHQAVFHRHVLAEAHAALAGDAALAVEQDVLADRDRLGEVALAARRSGCRPARGAG